MLKNPFAVDASDVVVHIDDATAEHGPFTCAGCKSPITLIPASRTFRRRNSTKDIKKRAHFSHVHEVICETGLETSLHLWAKMIIEEAMTVGLPPHRVAYRDLERVFETNWRYHHVEMEPWQDGIRPDVVLHHDEGQLNVEILVHHRVDERKAKILHGRQQSCIEIDLSAFDFERMPGEGLRNAILKDAPRIWIEHQLQEARLTILQSEWKSKLTELGRELRQKIDTVPHTISKDTRERHEKEIAEYGTAPFIGRRVQCAHWFAAPPRNWQHTVLNTYLHLTPADDAGEHNFYSPPLPWKRKYPFQNPNLPLDVDDEVLTAAGLTREEYGSPQQAIINYFRMLCDEPDNADVHPIWRRITSPGSAPGRLKRNPDWYGYLSRRAEIKTLFWEAARRRKFEEPEFARWLKTPIAPNGPSPRHLCAKGGPDYARLLAHLHAIPNMLNGGRPTDHLLGIEEKWLQAKVAKQYYKPYKQGGGCYPKGYADVFKICPSSGMMRAGRPLIDILATMAKRTHPTPEEADIFLNSAHSRLGGITPTEFTTDVASLQHCIDLMPVDPSRQRANGRRVYRRIW